MLHRVGYGQLRRDEQRRPHRGDNMPAEGGSHAKIRWKTIPERLREGQRQEGGLVFEKQKDDQHGQSMVNKGTVAENEDREVGRAQSHRAWSFVN